MEHWRVIEDFPDYAVSSLGRVKRLTPASGTHPGRVLVPSLSKGYLFVTLRRDKETIPVRLHVLVCRTFHGPRPTDSHDAAHNNGVRADNRKDNLRWATKVDNQRDRIEHGTDIRGSAVFGAVLVEADVQQIRSALRKGAVQRRLAEAFNVSPSTIHLINNGKIWRHVA